MWVGNFDPEEVTQEVLYELFLQVRPGLDYFGAPLADPARRAGLCGPPRVGLVYEGGILC